MEDWGTSGRFCYKWKKRYTLFYNLIQFRYTVHSSLRKVVAICIQIRWHFRFLVSKHMKFAIFIQFAFHYSVQIRPLQKPNCAFTKGSVTHALKQLRTACFRAVTILIWYPVGMCDCATACCLTERGRVVLSFISATGFCGSIARRHVVCSCVSASACCAKLCFRDNVSSEAVLAGRRVVQSCMFWDSAAASCMNLHYCYGVFCKVSATAFCLKLQ